jgi:hypothetical protein
MRLAAQQILLAYDDQQNIEKRGVTPFLACQTLSSLEQDRFTPSPTLLLLRTSALTRGCRLEGKHATETIWTEKTVREAGSLAPQPGKRSRVDGLLYNTARPARKSLNADASLADTTEPRDAHQPKEYKVLKRNVTADPRPVSIKTPVPARDIDAPGNVTAREVITQPTSEGVELVLPTKDPIVETQWWKEHPESLYGHRADSAQAQRRWIANLADQDLCADLALEQAVSGNGTGMNSISPAKSMANKAQGNTEEGDNESDTADAATTADVTKAEG